MAWTSKNERDKALTDADEAIRLNPEEGVFRGYRAELWYQKENTTRRSSTSARRFDSNPNDGIAFSRRGDTWKRMKAYDNAIQDFTAAIRLDPTSTQQHASRALALACKKEYDRALADYDEEIRLDPKNVWARADRGRAWLLKRNLEQAVADFNAAVKLDPKNPYAIYCRAVSSFVTHEKGALNGFKASLELGGWRGNVSVYAVLMAYFTAQCAGKADLATAMLRDAAAHCDTSAWPYPMIKYLRGELDDAKLMAAATDDDRMTEVRCFLGLKAFQEGKQDAARTHFRWVIEHGNASSTQYAISLIELDRLEGK